MTRAYSIRPILQRLVFRLKLSSPANTQSIVVELRETLKRPLLRTPSSLLFFSEPAVEKITLRVVLVAIRIEKMLSLLLEPTIMLQSRSLRENSAFRMHLYVYLLLALLRIRRRSPAPPSVSNRQTRKANLQEYSQKPTMSTYRLKIETTISPLVLSYLT